MLTKEENDFIEYWRLEREKSKHWSAHLRTGILYGLIFALPVLINYLSGWFTNIRINLPGTLLFICIATAGIAFFFSIFYQRYRWERKEQYYLELKAKETIKNT
ncbi:MAG: hypothetical protein HYX40_12315 [Sphingobacteriales bacterium]|nr:hypothetical protein [Sphingobacteriales bacterium]